MVGLGLGDLGGVPVEGVVGDLGGFPFGACELWWPSPTWCPRLCFGGLFGIPLPGHGLRSSLALTTT